MPKMKTKSAAKKRLRLTGTGKVRANVAYKRHCLSCKSAKMKRQARGTFMVAAADAPAIKKHFLPYGG
jgi:large subunit ribosomal protein L35